MKKLGSSRNDGKRFVMCMPHTGSRIPARAVVDGILQRLPDCGQEPAGSGTSADDATQEPQAQEVEQPE